MIPLDEAWFIIINKFTWLPNTYTVHMKYRKGMEVVS